LSSLVANSKKSLFRPVDFEGEGQLRTVKCFSTKESKIVLQVETKFDSYSPSFFSCSVVCNSQVVWTPITTHFPVSKDALAILTASITLAEMQRCLKKN
jgi:hypothetical protein